MIPAFDPDTGNLPPGIHEATWGEFVARYGYTVRRLTLLAGLKAGLDALRRAGCRRAYIDGSFVTSKTTPGDFDVCWESDGVQARLLDPVLLTFDNLRAAQKATYHGEFFFADAEADMLGTPYVDFFQRNRDGARKGIITMDLEVLRD